MFVTDYIATPSHIRGKILLVDDQPLNIKILHQLLHADYDLHMATNGEQAIEMCARLRPDLVLLDIEMPGMDGYQVCEQLKNDPMTTDIAVVFVTGHNDEETEVKGFQLGAVDFIHKPINPLITQVRVKNQIVLKRQSDLLRSIALLDSLTGVANRRKLSQSYPEAWAQCIREQVPISVVMIDIDFFKLFNDSYGHNGGDTCLRKVAQAIQTTVNRPYDLVARYGGEEFICILPKTDAKGARYVSQAIVSAVQALLIPHESSKVSDFVTVSVGSASVIPQRQFVEQMLIDAADQQLYLSKEQGRNRMNQSELVD